MKNGFVIDCGEFIVDDNSCLFFYKLNEEEFKVLCVWNGEEQFDLSFNIPKNQKFDDNFENWVIEQVSKQIFEYGSFEGFIDNTFIY